MLGVLGPVRDAESALAGSKAGEWVDWRLCAAPDVGTWVFVGTVLDTGRETLGLGACRGAAVDTEAVSLLS